MPDRVNGEFLNLGLVVFQVDSSQMEFRFIAKSGRISEVFPGSNSRFLLKTIENIKTNLEKFKDQLTNKLTLEQINNLDILTRKVLPKDDSALFFTKTEKTLDMNIEAAASYLFQRLISIHQSEEEKEVKQDKEVWTKVYKRYFEEAGISNHLKHHQIKTRFDEFNFDHSWKNGHWNFFEPIAFNLSRKESIKNKVYRLAGQIDSLSKLDENLHLYLLSLMPKDKELIDFINNLLVSKSSNNITVEVVTEDNLDEFTKEIKREIIAHENY